MPEMVKINAAEVDAFRPENKVNLPKFVLENE